MKFFFRKITADTKKLLDNLAYLVKNDVWYIKILSLLISVFVFILYAAFVIVASIIFIMLFAVSVIIFIVVQITLVIPCTCLLFLMDKGGILWRKIRRKGE